VQISIVGIQSDPKYYQKPTEFFPEHFTAEQKANRHPYAFMPFGQVSLKIINIMYKLYLKNWPTVEFQFCFQGPRNCIGDFNLEHFKIISCKVLQYGGA